MRRIILSTLLLVGATLGMHARQLNASVEETIPGKAWTMTFTLSEVTNYTALSLQLTLPEQVQAASIAAGTALQATHEVLMGRPTNGSLKIILYSSQSALLPAGEATFSLQLQSSEALSETEYALALSDIRFADAQGAETKVDDKSVVLPNTPAPAPDVLGDVNGDGAFSAADVVTLLNALVGLPNATYYADRADMDANGEVSIGDVVLLCNKIMEQPASVRPQEQMPTATMQVRITDTTLPTRSEGVAQLMVEVNENQYSALQMNVTLPQGVQLDGVQLPESLQGMESCIRLLEDGSYRLMVYANGGITLPGTSVSLGLRLKTSEAIQGDMQILAATASTNLGQEERLSDHSAKLVVDDALTGIQQVQTGGGKSHKVYDLRGRLLKQPIKGIFIRDGKKYIR